MKPERSATLNRLPPAAATASAVLDYGGLGIHVNAPPADLAWLRECLGPDFPEPSGLTSDDHLHEIALIADAEAFDELHARGPNAEGRTVGGCVLDLRVERLPLWGPQDRAVVVFDAERLTFCRRVSRRRVELVARPGNRAARTALLRAVRETAANHVAARRALVVHGAAFAWKGRGCVIAGSKMAGKTTLLLHLLAQGADFIANDRTVVWRDTEPPALRGVPTIVNVRASSLEWFPALQRTFAIHGYHHRYSIEEAEQAGPRRAPREADWSLSPAQFVRLVGVRRCADVPLTAVLFPRRDEAQRGIRVEELSGDDAAQRLRGALLARDPRGLVADFYRDPDLQGAMNDELTVDGLAGRVRMFECTLGADAYEDPATARLLVELM